MADDQFSTPPNNNNGELGGVGTPPNNNNGELGGGLTGHISPAPITTKTTRIPPKIHSDTSEFWYEPLFILTGGMSPIQVREAKEQKTKNCPVRLTSMIKSREEFNSVYTLPNVEKEKSGGAASTRKSKCSKMEQLLKDGGYGEFIRKTTCCSLWPKTSREAVAKINAMSEDLSVIYIWMARFMNWRFTRTTTQDGVMTSEYDNFQSGVAKGVATPPHRTIGH
jgi:hypothetical protein